MKLVKDFCTTYLAIPNPAEKIEVAQVTQYSAKDPGFTELKEKYKLSLPIKTWQRPESPLNATTLNKISMKAWGTASKNISITPIFEK